MNDADEIEDLQDFFDLQAYLEQLEETEVLLRCALAVSWSRALVVTALKGDIPVVRAGDIYRAAHLRSHGHF